jgi:hypothetical protein
LRTALTNFRVWLLELLGLAFMPNIFIFVFSFSITLQNSTEISRIGRVSAYIQFDTLNSNLPFSVHALQLFQILGWGFSINI